MPRYWWFQGKTVMDLTGQLQAAGPDAILEVHPEGDGVLLRVVGVDQKSADVAPLNESHPCPPFCRD